jgi:hypothetical protein
LLRGLYFAIVDEADSVLIDEARTPLIISSDVDDPKGRALYEQALALAASLKKKGHYLLRPKERSIELTDAGRAAVGDFARGLPGLWRIPRAREELVEQGLSALHLFQLDRHYIIADDKVQIVDEYTGRVMADRSWERGLHQMIEVKEALAISKRRDTISRITYQRFFRRYLCLAGMSGTATEVAPEMRSVYALDVLRIPPNRPVVRRDLGQRVFLDSDAALGGGGRARRRDGAGGTGGADRHAFGGRFRVGQSVSERGRTGARSAQRAPGSREAEIIGRPVSRGGSPWPPTWPGAAPTSCSARKFARPAACTSSFPNTMIRRASTGSSSAVPVGRAIRDHAKRSSRSMTNCLSPMLQRWLGWLRARVSAGWAAAGTARTLLRRSAQARPSGRIRGFGGRRWKWTSASSSLWRLPEEE